MTSGRAGGERWGLEQAHSALVFFFVCVAAILCLAVSEQSVCMALLNLG